MKATILRQGVNFFDYQFDDGCHLYGNYGDEYVLASPTGVVVPVDPYHDNPYLVQATESNATISTEPMPPAEEAKVMAYFT